MVCRSIGRESFGRAAPRCQRWLDTDVDRDFESTSTVHIRFIPIHADIKGGAPADVERSLSADAITSVALAASGTRAWLARQTVNDRIRVKAFDVGPSPDFAVTPRPTVTLPDAGTSTGWIEMTAVGSKLVIAYGIESSTFVRVSTDGGASFGPRERLLHGIFGGDLHTTPLSADIRGSRVVVHAAELGGFKDLETIAYRFESADLGASWSGVRRYSDGLRMGAFTVLGGGTRLVEAWDRSTSNLDRKPVRFHRHL